MTKNILILWDASSICGTIEAVRCRVSELCVVSEGEAKENSFKVYGKNAGILITADEICNRRGANTATITVRSEASPFTFKLDDISSLYPVFIPEYHVIVTSGDDSRTYEEIKRDILFKKQLSSLQKIETDSEESYAAAAEHTINNRCPTWLGLSRDIRIFEIGIRDKRMDGFWPVDSIDVKNHFQTVTRYEYLVGRGIGCTDTLKRSLEDDYWPILNSLITDGGITYSSQFFVTLERSALKEENISGTHYLVADANSIGHSLTPEQEKEKEALWDSEMNPEEETVLFVKIIAENTTDAPAYSWMKLPKPAGVSCTYDYKTGFGISGDDKIYMVATIDGKPVDQNETAVLIPPGEKITYLFKIPHSPVSAERAAALASQDYTEKLNQCKTFWENKMSGMMKIKLPEKRIENMLKAGFCHLDLICYGKEPEGTLAPDIGVYSPIGSESSPILQFLNSFGGTKTSQRALEFFYKKQHEDGLIQNFGGYMLENGAVLWTTYLHMLYTGNLDWIKGMETHILKACDYLIDWIQRNKRQELTDIGYGMIDGKVADPEDPFHSYMLNAYAYAGLFGAGRVLKEINSPHFEKVSEAAAELKGNILKTLERSFADAPVVPIGNGFWCPSISPWVEYRGPISLYTDGGEVYTHGSSLVRDSLLGAIYLVYLNIVEINDVYANFIINSFSALFYERHTGFSQPFYSPHGLIHLKRNEKKAFLKEFYNSFSGLADRETYTFWEHFCQISVHKTHEEAWFLMRCRNMLYSENLKDDGNHELLIMPGVPTGWFLSGETISVQDANSYYGILSYTFTHDEFCSRLAISVRLKLRGSSYPKIIVRLPLPENLTVSSVNTGSIIEGTNDILIDQFNGNVLLNVDLKKISSH